MYLNREQRWQIREDLSTEWLRLAEARQRVRRVRRVGSHLMPVVVVTAVVLLALGSGASPIALGVVATSVSLAGTVLANLPLPEPRRRLGTPDTCAHEDAQ